MLAPMSVCYKNRGTFIPSTGVTLVINDARNYFNEEFYGFCDCYLDYSGERCQIPEHTTVATSTNFFVTTRNATTVTMAVSDEGMMKETTTTSDETISPITDQTNYTHNHTEEQPDSTTSTSTAENF